jgi:alkanesulfonate monooxygenase
VGLPTIDLFSTCPPSKAIEAGAYRQTVGEISRWSEEAGCRGILVYTDNGLVDPWLVAQVVIESTKVLNPLVAIQPVYMHPYSVAKMITSLAFLHGRSVDLNMVAGGFKGDLVSLNGYMFHDERYVRMVEYTKVIKQLLAASKPMSYEGSFYSVKNLRMMPQLPKEFYPGVFVSGSSEAGLAAAKAIGAVPVKYPKPPGEEISPGEGFPRGGLRVGIIARETGAEAWAVGYARFPEDRRGQLTHQLAMKVSDSQWHHQLSRLGENPPSEENPYWLRPFQNYKTFCPYLVGSYETVGAELARYMRLGFRTYILDVPPSREEFHHTAVAFQVALGKENFERASS